MLSFGLTLLLSLLLAAFVLLFCYFVVRKLRRTGDSKKNAEVKALVIQKINGFIDASDLEFKTGLDEFVKEVLAAKKIYRDMTDEYLLRLLETPDLKNLDRYIMTAWRLDLTSECTRLIRNGNPPVCAAGARRAGLYRYRDAANDMLTALNSSSGESQFEILLALARMGDAETLRKSFDRIQKNILINERGVIRILSAFPPGDEKKKLFRDMLSGGSDYLTALFLKALGGELAASLREDITRVLRTGNKEVRAAAVRGFAFLGTSAPEEELIQALEDHEWEVRALAAKALGVIQSPESSQALFRALFDQQWWVRQNAASSMLNHPGYEDLFILAAEAGDEYTKDSIIYALENTGNPVLLRSIKIMAA